MTIDSIPVSKLGQWDAGFLAAHCDALFKTIKAYAAIASPSAPTKFSSFAFMFSWVFFTRALILGMHLKFRNPRRSQVAPNVYTWIITYIAMK